MPKKNIVRTVIPADPALPRRTIEPANGKRLTLEEAQAVVGGYIEPVYLPGKRVLYVNEEGLLHGLPLNERASIVGGRVLVGDALLVKGGSF